MTPGSSNARESGEAMTYPAGRRPGARSNSRVVRSYRQCRAGSSYGELTVNRSIVARATIPILYS